MVVVVVVFFKLKADLQPYSIYLVYINLTIEVYFMILMSCKCFMYNCFQIISSIMFV